MTSSKITTMYWPEQQWTPFSSVIGAMILAWFLSLFGLDKMLIKGLNQVLEREKRPFDTNVYWLVFFGVALMFGSIMWIVQVVSQPARTPASITIVSPQANEE